MKTEQRGAGDAERWHGVGRGLRLELWRCRPSAYLEAVGVAQNWRRHDGVSCVHGGDKSDDNDRR
jgi:hypothetical protein